MEIKIDFKDLQNTLEANEHMKNLLVKAEATLARMQRRLPDSSKYDRDAQACANTRGDITNFFESQKKLSQCMNCGVCIHHLQIDEKLGGVVCNALNGDGILIMIPKECDYFELLT